MKPQINSTEERAMMLGRVDRLLKLQNAATQLELLIRKSREFEAQRVAKEKHLLEQIKAVRA